MSSKRYPEEFKSEAVKQITERGYSVADVAGRFSLLPSLVRKLGQRTLQGA